MTSQTGDSSWEQQHHKDKTYKLIKDIRNREIHNESPLELMWYKFEPPLIPVSQGYVLSNEDLHNYIVHVISLLIPLANSLQNIIEKISPGHIILYYKDRIGETNDLIKMEERYKHERVLFAAFSPQKNNN